jgi:acyl-CoA dehydrogenase
MDFSLPEEHLMLQDLVQKFVADELLPIESKIIAREVSGEGVHLTSEERSHIDARAKSLGLFGLDAPKEMGGFDLPQTALVGVNEELGYSAVSYMLPPDSPNLHMLLDVGTDAQKQKYMMPYLKGELQSAIAISEPGAGSDPAGMKTRAVRDGDGWVLNGRKIWISGADDADFFIAVAVTDPEKRARGGITAFIIDKDTPGLSVGRKIPMLAGHATFELAFEDCHVSHSSVLGEVGQGFAPMQGRLNSRRMEMAGWCLGVTRRALDMMVEYAPQRETFGSPLSERQSVQWWIADIQTRLHACRLMTQHAAWKIDQRQDARTEASMVKVYSTEMAYEAVDHAMQLYGGMGMSKETPLYLLSEQARLMRIFEGPSEVHRWLIARDRLGRH